MFAFFLDDDTICHFMLNSDWTVEIPHQQSPNLIFSLEREKLSWSIGGLKIFLALLEKKIHVIEISTNSRILKCSYFVRILFVFVRIFHIASCAPSQQPVTTSSQHRHNNVFARHNTVTTSQQPVTTHLRRSDFEASFLKYHILIEYFPNTNRYSVYRRYQIWFFRCG